MPINDKMGVPDINGQLIQVHRNCRNCFYAVKKNGLMVGQFIAECHYGPPLIVFVGNRELSSQFPIVSDAPTMFCNCFLLDSEKSFDNFVAIKSGKKADFKILPEKCIHCQIKVTENKDNPCERCPDNPSREELPPPAA
ncbi:MAG: hypothetical protein WBM07_17065 [Chitinivibrionales bacterium]